MTLADLPSAMGNRLVRFAVVVMSVAGMVLLVLQFQFIGRRHTGRQIDRGPRPVYVLFARNCQPSHSRIRVPPTTSGV
jgi:hypothetical protein